MTNIKDLLGHALPLDLETTGIDPDKHAMLSLGVSLFNGKDLLIENSFRDDALICEKALAINGENENDLRSRSPLSGYPSEADALKRLMDFCKENDTWVILGKNPRFDYSFLKAIWDRSPEFDFYCHKFPFSYRVIDYGTLAIPLMLKSGIKMPMGGFSSSDIQDFLGVDIEPIPHTALTGARYNKACTLKILELYEKDK